MLLTILILIACAVMATIGTPLMLKVVPPNEYYGFPTRDMRKDPKRWVRVNFFAGTALVAAAAFTAIVLMMWNGTWLRSGWAQIAALIFPLGIAIGATFLYERR
jgi:uncharacterized membrane protein